MSAQEPRGPYVYQPFGPVSHPDRAATGRLYGVGGLPYQARVEGLTRDEAERIVGALAGIGLPESRPHGVRRRLMILAREIGDVSSVAQRPSVLDADTRQMIARLDAWRTVLLDCARELDPPDAPVTTQVRSAVFRFAAYLRTRWTDGADAPALFAASVAEDFLNGRPPECATAQVPVPPGPGPGRPDAWAQRWHGLKAWLTTQLPADTAREGLRYMRQLEKGFPEP